MRRQTAYLMAVGMVVAALAGGCSSLENKVNAITGRSDKNATRVELNSAGRKRLAALSGLTGADADKIVANRPYQNRRDLVRKGVLSDAQFEKIKDSVYVEHGKD